MHEKEREKCKVTQENSALTEVVREMLVSELKDDLCCSTEKSEDEDYEFDEKAHEVMENNRKCIDKKCNIEHMKRGYTGGRIKGQEIAEIMSAKLKSKEAEVEKILKDKRKEESAVNDKREEESEEDDSSSYSELDSSDDESEHEYGDSFDKLFDG